MTREGPLDYSPICPYSNSNYPFQHRCVGGTVAVNVNALLGFLEDFATVEGCFA